MNEWVRSMGSIGSIKTLFDIFKKSTNYSVWQCDTGVSKISKRHKIRTQIQSQIQIDGYID